jgi:CII-binding regulator of phage lambda lysogenization HflD
MLTYEVRAVLLAAVRCGNIAEQMEPWYLVFSLLLLSLCVE